VELDIQHRSIPSSAEDSLPPPGTEESAKDAASTKWIPASLGWMEGRLGNGGDFVWRSLRSRPLIGVAAAAALGLGLAVTVGAGELAIAFATGYAAYQVLQRHEPPSKAIEKAAKICL
jgi:hypothetical protein